MAKKTRKEDALSIIKEEALVEEVEKAALETKSDVLVEMSETETVVEESQSEPVAKPVQETPVVEEACTDKPKDKKGHPDGDMEDEEEEMPKKKSLSVEDIQAIAEVVKSLISQSSQPAEAVVPEEVKVEKSALDISVENLYNSVNQAMQTKNVTIEERLASINPALQELGQAITEQVKQSVGVETKTEANDGGMVLEALTSLTNTVKDLATEVATLKAHKSQAPEQPRIPAPRGVIPIIQASMTTEKPVNPNSVTNIVRRSVSSQLELK